MQEGTLSLMQMENFSALNSFIEKSKKCSFDELEEQLKQGKIKKIKKTIQAIKKAVQDTMEFALRLMNKQK